MLIGRDHEQQTIDRLVAAARIGSGSALLLTGEPGVGKTALLAWAAGRLEGFRVLRATGTEPERDVPFAGLLTLLRPALPLLESVPSPQAQALSAALALRPGPAGDRFAIGAATLSLLCRCAEEAPVAVLVDDVQLLDRPSAEALLFAARRLGSDPVLVLVAGREGETGAAAGLDRLRVPGLQPGATGGLVDALSPGPVTDEWRARVHELTGGNPLAVVELAADPTALAHTGPTVPPPLSTALVEAFGRRVRALTPAARTVLLVAILANGDLGVTTAACSRLGADPGHLEDLRHAGLVDLVDGGEIGFRHPLLRAAGHADSTPAERRAVHAAVAAVLPDDDIDRRAWHLSESVWEPDAAIADLLEQAARNAAERSAYAVAATAHERAARLTPDPDTAAARRLAAAEAAWSAGLGPRAVALLDDLPARGGSSDPGAVQLRAAIALRTGSVSGAAELLERSAEGTVSADVRTLLRAEAVHACFLAADGAGGLRLATVLEPDLASVSSSWARGVGTLALGMAKVLAGTGGADELRAAVPLLAGSDAPPLDDRGVSWLMYAPLFIRDAETGRDLRHRVDAARDRAGVGTLPTLLFLVARDHATTQDWARAAADYTEAVRLARDTGQETELTLSLAGLAALEARRGRVEECRAHAAEAVSLARDRGLHWAEVVAVAALGDLALGAADPAAALPHLVEVDRLLTRRRVGDADLSPGPDLVDVLLRLGREDEARHAAAEVARVAEAKGQPWARARAWRCRGLVATEEALDAPFREALALHAQTPDSFEAARTRLAYGARLRRAGRRVDAREQLRGALAGFAALGAEPWADQAATELHLTGERVPQRALGGPGALTPQELQVALLLAGGRTTREAAAALFLSPKTVEYHLRKTYAKLGIRSREELAAVLGDGRGDEASGSRSRSTGAAYRPPRP